METKHLSLTCLYTATVLIVGVEWLIQPLVIELFRLNSFIIITGIIRLLELFVLLGIVKYLKGSLTFISLSIHDLKQSVKRGLAWGIGVGAIITMALTGLWLINPQWLTSFVSSSFYQSELQLLTIIVAAVIGPITEEIFFRGIVFHTFRNQGFILAAGISAISFAVFHWNNHIPFVQLIGGLLFIVILEKEKSLLSPIIAHCFGNFVLIIVPLFFELP